MGVTDRQQWRSFSQGAFPWHNQDEHEPWPTALPLRRKSSAWETGGDQPRVDEEDSGHGRSLCNCSVREAERSLRFFKSKKSREPGGTLPGQREARANPESGVWSG